MKACNRCAARLPPRFFPLVNGKRQARCSPCLNSDRRLRASLPPESRDPQEIRINNLTQLWFGPVRREPMRSIA